MIFLIPLENGYPLCATMNGESVRKLGVQRSKLRDYIQKNVFEQNIEFFTPHCSISLGMHLGTVREKLEHHDDLLGRVMRSLSRMKKRL